MKKIIAILVLSFGSHAFASTNAFYNLVEVVGIRSVLLENALKERKSLMTCFELGALSETVQSLEEIIEVEQIKLAQPEIELMKSLSSISSEICYQRTQLSEDDFVGLEQSNSNIIEHLKAID